MSDAPELLWLWPAEPEDGVDKFVSFPGQPYPSGSTTYIRADLSDALLREAMEALEFYGNPDAWKYPPVKVLDGLFTVEYENAASKVKMDRGKQASATLAKLRAHLGEME